MVLRPKLEGWDLTEVSEFTTALGSVSERKTAIVSITALSYQGESWWTLAPMLLVFLCATWPGIKIGGRRGQETTASRTVEAVSRPPRTADRRDGCAEQSGDYPAFAGDSRASRAGDQQWG